MPVLIRTRKQTVRRLSALSTFDAVVLLEVLAQRLHLGIGAAARHPDRARVGLAKALELGRRRVAGSVERLVDRAGLVPAHGARAVEDDAVPQLVRLAGHRGSDTNNVPLSAPGASR